MAVRSAMLVLLGSMLAGGLVPDHGMLYAAESAEIGQQSGGPGPQQCDRDFAVGRYYIGKHDYAAAINRFKITVQTCPTSSDIPEALAYLAEAFLALGVAPLAQTAVAVLERRFPNTRSTTEARGALRSAGLAPVEDERSWIALAFR